MKIKSNNSKKALLNRFILSKGIIMSMALYALGSFNLMYANEVNNTERTEIQQSSVVNISGKVTDELGFPIPGVTVSIKDLQRGTTTNSEGTYSILNVPSNGVLTFTYIGFVNQSINVSNRTSIDVVLEENTTMLSEVVVTALGIKREEKALGYSVQKVGGESLQTVKSVDLGTSLTGKISGLMVRNTTEFAGTPNITLRGENPLLVIDGIPYGNMSLRDIANDDIEDISVLKGATASALYGYRGAGGAIMITTKQGSKDQGLSVSFNSSSMFTAGYLAIPEVQHVFGRPIEANNTYTRSLSGAWGPPMEGQEVIQWDPISKTMKPMPYLPIGKDNFKNFLEQGYILNNNINLVQQGRYGSFRTSATWVNNKGPYPNSMFNKYTFSIGGDMKIDKFTLSANFSYNKQSSPNIGFNAYRGYDPMYSILLLSAADFDIRQYKDYWFTPNEVQNNSYTTSHNNPYFDMNERLHTLDRDIVNGMFSLNYDFKPWLKGMARLGYDSYTNSQDVRISQGSYTGGGIATVIGGGTEIWGESVRGSYSTGLSRSYSINGDFMLSAEKTFGDFHVDGFGGGTIYYTDYNAIESRTQGGLSVPGFYALKASVNPLSTGVRRNKRQVNSLFAKAGVSWRSTAFLEATLRNDWSSTLPESTRSYLYPSLAGSFIASEMLPKMDWLMMWKLRSSWTISKTPASIYEINQVYNISQNAWGSMSSANLPSSIRNSDINPETSETIEVGTFISLFDNRVSFDAAHYSKRMYDFIRSAGISSASGYSSKYQNIDEERTRKGLEFTASFVPVRTKDLEWRISANWSKYRTRYTKLDETFSSKSPWVQVGNRTDTYTANEYLKNPASGQIIHVNGLPQYSSYSSVIDYSDPDWIWGLSTGVKYKNFSLNIAMDGRVGGLTESFTEAYMWRGGTHPNSVTDERYKDATIGGSNYVGSGVKVVSGSVRYDTYGNIMEDTRVFAPNDHHVTYKAYTEALHKNFAWGGSASPLDILSTTFMKVREISLTYNVPKSVSSKLKAKNIAVSAIGSNIFMWAKEFKYSDPDGGSENLSDPSLRYVGVNFKIDF